MPNPHRLSGKMPEEGLPSQSFLRHHLKGLVALSFLVFFSSRPVLAFCRRFVYKKIAINDVKTPFSVSLYRGLEPPEAIRGLKPPEACSHLFSALV